MELWKKVTGFSAMLAAFFFFSLIWVDMDDGG